MILGLAALGQGVEWARLGYFAAVDDTKEPKMTSSWLPSSTQARVASVLDPRSKVSRAATSDQPRLGPSRRKLIRFVGPIVACEAVGGLAALVSGPAVSDWLPPLDQPRFQPPDWVFGPVWTVFYGLIGMSWRITHDTGAGQARRAAEGWLAVQLVLNAAWSYIFFGQRRIGWALVDSALLATAVAVALYKVRRVSGAAAILLVPYLAWVIFATALNAALWHKNR